VKGEQVMYEIFEQLLQIHGVTPYKVSKATGISQSSLSDWKMGKITPKTATLKKIADYFGVSLDYLTTGKEVAEEHKNPYSDIKGVYLSYAKEAQDSGIDPDDIRLALETIKRLRGDKK
jgi:transcriptional regulator with XRE-family HTH domain